MKMMLRTKIRLKMEMGINTIIMVIGKKNTHFIDLFVLGLSMKYVD